MALPTLEKPNEVRGPFDETVEEIRAICRLHACPTGHWENLIDLPRRISQDAGLRFDFIAIVQTLQRSRFNLPDVLDLLVLAVGGASAPRHSHQLSEQLNLLGGFLTGIGRWPSTDSEPILAPGEVPADLAKFTRPQSPSTLSSQPGLQHSSSQPELQHSSSRPERSEVEGPAFPPTLSSQPELQHLSSRPERSEVEGPAFPPTHPTLASQPAPERAKPLEEEVERPASLPEPSTKPAEISEIANALARLERGNLELRAHLDSIDQRIGRMEPRLELSSPPADLAPAPDPSPVLLHRGISTRDTIETSPLHTDPLRAYPLPAAPASSPLRHAQPLRAEAPQSSPISVRPISVREDRKGQEDRGEARTARELRKESRPHDEPRYNEPERTGNTPAWAVAAETQAGATPARQRFSRFSRDPISPDPVSSAPISPASISPAPTFPDRISLDPDPASTAKPVSPAAVAGPPFAREEVVLKPSTLPRGFFGTVPDSDSEAAAAEIEPRSRRKGSGLILTVLLLLILLGAAALIYRHNIATEPDTAANSSDVTPVAAPRPTPTGTISSHGPLTATPTHPVATEAAPSAGNKVLGARGAFHTSQSTEEPHSGGFRPAGTFVPAPVMEGHLLSAPIPQQARSTSASASSGLVVMEANISATGQVEDLHVLGGSSALRIPAIEAVRNWRYRPYLVNGSPVEVRTIVRVDLKEHKSEPADRSAPFPR